MPFASLVSFLWLFSFSHGEREREREREKERKRSFEKMERQSVHLVMRNVMPIFYTYNLDDAVKSNGLLFV